MSYKPSRAASSGPLTSVRPFEPSTYAATILGELPRNPVGKIDKPALRRLLADSLVTTSTNGS